MANFVTISSKKRSPDELIPLWQKSIEPFNGERFLGILAEPSNGNCFIKGLALTSANHAIYIELENFIFNKVTHDKYYQQIADFIKDNCFRLYAYDCQQTITLLYEMYGIFFPLQDFKALAIVKGEKEELSALYNKYYQEQPPFTNATLNQCYMQTILARTMYNDDYESANAVYLANQHLNTMLSMSAVKIDLKALQSLYRKYATVNFNSSLFLNYITLLLKDTTELKANAKLTKLVGYYGFKNCLADPKTLAINFGDFLRKHKEIFDDVIDIYNEELQYIAAISDARWSNQKTKPRVMQNIGQRLEEEWGLTALKKDFVEQEELNESLAKQALQLIVPERTWETEPVKNLEAYANYKADAYKKLCERLPAFANNACHALMQAVSNLTDNEELNTDVVNADNTNYPEIEWNFSDKTKAPWIWLNAFTKFLQKPQKVLKQYVSNIEKCQLVYMVLLAIQNIKEAQMQLRTYKQIRANCIKGKAIGQSSLYTFDRELQGDLFNAQYNANIAATNRWSSPVHNMLSADSEWKQCFIPKQGTNYYIPAEGDEYEKQKDAIKINDRLYRPDDLVKLVDGWCLACEFLPEKYQLGD